MNERNRRTNRFHYGICLNDECSKCRNKEIQKIPLRKELICEECGKQLRECAPVSKKNPTRYIVFGIIVIGLIGVFILNRTGKKDVVQQTSDTISNVNIHADTILTGQVVSIGNVVKEDSIVFSNETESTENQISSLYKLEFGSYDGPMNHGKPHGYGGTIKVNCSYNIDLKKMPAEYLQVDEGDVIVSTKFIDGILRAGELHRKDGTRKVFTI